MEYSRAFRWRQRRELKISLIYYLESDDIDLIFTVQTNDRISDVIFSATKRAAAKVAFGAIFHFQTFRFVERLSRVELPAVAELLVYLRETRWPRETRPRQTFFELD